MEAQDALRVGHTKPQSQATASFCRTFWWKHAGAARDQQGSKDSVLSEQIRRERHEAIPLPVSSNLVSKKGEKISSFFLSGKCNHSLGEVLSVQAPLSPAESPSSWAPLAFLQNYVREELACFSLLISSPYVLLQLLCCAATGHCIC